MSFDWTEYLNLAETLVREKAIFTNEEACLRAAISRAYYSAFCAARNRARDLDGLAVTNATADHGLVKQHYQAATDRRRKKIGTWLDRLRLNRNHVDYEDSVSQVDALCNSSLAQARNVLNELKTL